MVWSPCGVEKMPVRARFFLEVIWNSNIGLIIQDEKQLHASIEVDSVSSVLSTELQINLRLLIQ